MGPIKFCDLKIHDFLVFTGPQASGKSTIAKSIFFFKNIKNTLFLQYKKKHLLNGEIMELPIKNRLIREIRSNFLQTFGSTWGMDNDMSLQYYYTDSVYIKILLKKDPQFSNYIWVEFSPSLVEFLDSIDSQTGSLNLITNFDMFDEVYKQINTFFDDDAEIIYIPAGRSMITLLSTQLNYIYSSMDDLQKRSLDYCTQNYLERILKIKPYFSESLFTLIKNKMELTDEKVNKEVLLLCAETMKDILHGEYRIVNGEERLQMSANRYVKINFASSGQQESVWILNVLFYYLLHNKKSYFIIEEPESHLFPNAQKLITEFISLANTAGNQILLTTHSPYILGTLNNLLYANKISKYVNKNRLNQIIDRHKWLDFHLVSAYFLNQGIPESCLDEGFESIENEIIDGASEEINHDYEKMLDLKEIAEQGKE